MCGDLQFPVELPNRCTGLNLAQAVVDLLDGIAGLNSCDSGPLEFPFLPNSFPRRLDRLMKRAIVHKLDSTTKICESDFYP